MFKKRMSTADKLLCGQMCASDASDEDLLRIRKRMTGFDLWKIVRDELERRRDEAIKRRER